jgi:hypothetical protein
VFTSRPHPGRGWEAFSVIEKPNGLWVFFKNAEPIGGAEERES